MATLIRNDREKHWMYKLKTLAPFGLNATDGSNQTRSHPNRPRPQPGHSWFNGSLIKSQGDRTVSFSQFQKYSYINVLVLPPVVDHHMVIPPLTVIPTSNKIFLKEIWSEGRSESKLGSNLFHCHMFLFTINIPCDTWDIIHHKSRDVSLSIVTSQYYIYCEYLRNCIPLMLGNLLMRGQFPWNVCRDAGLLLDLRTFSMFSFLIYIFVLQHFSINLFLLMEAFNTFFSCLIIDTN